MARIIASATRDAQGRDLLSAIGASTDLLPRILDPLERVGAVVPDLPKPLSRLAGVPVFCCSNDTWTGVAGLGALRPGLAYNISGTTEVLGVVSETSGFAEGLMSVDWCGVHQLGGPSQNGADTIAWLLDLFGQFNGGYASVGSGIDALLAGQRDPQPVVFLPYLQGERVPYWDASLRGAFVGLNRRHGATDLAWAVLEGIACLNRIVLDKAEAALGFTVSEIRFGGGAARNPTWQQLKADICRRPVVVGVSEQPGILGAAIVAWTGTGRFSSLAQAQERLVKVASRCEPDAIRGKAYALLFELYRRCEQALAPISHDLAGFARENGPLLGAPIAASRPGEEPSA
jgi:xylulokinase